MTPLEVMAMRKDVQEALGLGITAAQDWCAAAVHTSRRAWQQWERGERGIHDAVAELAAIKVNDLNANCIAETCKPSGRSKKEAGV